MRRGRTVLATAAGAALAAGVAVLPMQAAQAAQVVPVQAQAQAQILPEYYQFCHDRPDRLKDIGPGWYAGAKAEQDGVWCYTWRLVGGFFPVKQGDFVNWTTVCGSLGYANWSWDGQYPWCSSPIPGFQIVG